MSRRSRRFFLVLVGGSVLLAGGGLAGASFVKSPAQLAAQTAAPPPAVLTAPVTRQVVTSQVTLRGTVVASGQKSVTPASEVGANSLVITGKYVSAGDQVQAGQVLLSVSGRPLFALPGAFPAYRDMVPGDVGPDVAELQQALGALGYPVGGDPAGKFASGTEAAVSEFYKAIGYPVPTTTQAAAGQGAASQGSGGQGAANLSAFRVAGSQPAASAQSASPAASSGQTPAPSPGTTQKAAPMPSKTQQAQSPESQSPGPSPSKAPASLPMVPQSEVAFLPKLPARVISVKGGVGDTVSAPLLTLNTGSLGVLGQLDPSQRGLVRAGMQVRLSDNVTGWTGSGTVEGLGAEVSPSSGSAYVPVTIRPRGSVPSAESGADIELQIMSASSGKSVLAVPEAAVNVNAANQTFVRVRSASGAIANVTVQPGVSGGGVVAVTPVGGRLAAGEQVVTGQ